jgi:N6-adenosine-specific RNA methylase IME4
MSTAPQELVLLGKVERMLAEATTIDEVKHIRDTAEAARGYAKKIGLSRDIIVHASTIKVRAERRLGEMLGSLPLAKSAPGNQHTGELDRSQNATGPIRLQDLGITKSDSSRAQQVASLPTATFNRYVKDCVESGQEPTTAGLLRLVKQTKVQDSVATDTTQHDRLVRDLQPLIAAGRRFATIYADPPWQYDNQATRAATGNHYPTLSLEDIAAHPVAELAAENAHLHLWTTNGFLAAALELIKVWGFEYKSIFVWVKPQLGIGNYWRCSHEMMLLGVRGHLPFLDHGQRSWLELDRQGHSVKPPEIRSLIEKTSPPNYIELFAREVPENPAWTVYGNQFLSPSKRRLSPEGNIQFS